ncbi:glycosyltransferase [Parasphingopyxis algicola]|nr:glycosyltransferase [Parasphingopyxis algicola]
MPMYNVERYIGEAIQSVLDQDFEDFELIIVDDASLDGSNGICHSFKDPRIRVIAQRNRGLAGARNTGVAAARGRFIALLDSDDRWVPSKLGLHFIHLTANPDVDVSYSGSRFINEAGLPLALAMRPKLEDVTAKDIVTRNPVGNGSAPVIRKSALDRVAFRHPAEPERTCWFDESFRQSEDIEMWLRMAVGAGCRFEGISGLLTEYRVASGGLSANIARQYESWCRMIDKTAGYAPGFIRKHRAAAEAYQLRYLARRSVQLGDGAFALALVRQSLARNARILFQEPGKTLSTALAAAAARWLPSRAFDAVAQWRLGAGLKT